MFRVMPILDSRREVPVQVGGRVQVYNSAVRTVCDGCDGPLTEGERAIRQTVAHFDGAVRVGQAFLHYHKACVPAPRPGQAHSMS